MGMQLEIEEFLRNRFEANIKIERLPTKKYSRGHLVRDTLTGNEDLQNVEFYLTVSNEKNTGPTYIMAYKLGIKTNTFPQYLVDILIDSAAGSVASLVLEIPVTKSLSISHDQCLTPLTCCEDLLVCFMETDLEPDDWRGRKCLAVKGFALHSKFSKEVNFRSCFVDLVGPLSKFQVMLR